MSITIKEAEYREPVGLEDGGHTIIECSNCGESLVDIHVTRPKENFQWKMQANCPHCGDHSFQYNIVGGFHPGAIGHTIIDTIETQDDLIIFNTIKGEVNNEV